MHSRSNFLKHTLKIIYFLFLKLYHTFESELYNFSQQCFRKLPLEIFFMPTLTLISNSGEFYLFGVLIQRGADFENKIQIFTFAKS